MYSISCKIVEQIMKKLTFILHICGQLFVCPRTIASFSKVGGEFHNPDLFSKKGEGAALFYAEQLFVHVHDVFGHKK